MKRDEDYSMIRPNYKAEYLAYRSGLIGLIRTVAKQAGLSRQVYFLGINYMDDVLSRTLFPKQECQLIALCSLFLAGIPSGG